LIGIARRVSAFFGLTRTMTHRRRSLPQRRGGVSGGGGWQSGHRATMGYGIRMRTRREAGAARVKDTGDAEWDGFEPRSGELLRAWRLEEAGPRHPLVYPRSPVRRWRIPSSVYHRLHPPTAARCQSIPTCSMPLPLLLVCFVLPASAPRDGWWIRCSSSRTAARATIHLPDFTVPLPLVVNRYSCSPHPPCSPAPSSTSVPNSYLCVQLAADRQGCVSADDVID
jgi:hypothetical protein